MPPAKLMVPESLALETAPTEGEALAFLPPAVRGTLLVSGTGMAALGAAFVYLSVLDFGGGSALLLQGTAFGGTLALVGGYLVVLAGRGYRPVEVPKLGEAAGLAGAFGLVAAAAAISGHPAMAALTLLLGLLVAGAGTFDLARRRRRHLSSSGQERVQIGL